MNSSHRLPLKQHVLTRIRKLCVARSCHVVIGYFLLGSAWIWFSGWALPRIAPNPRWWTFGEIAKGQLFITVTSGLLYFGIQLTIGRLHSSEQKWKLLFDAAPDAYYLHDSDGTFLDGNVAAEQLTGYTRTELVGSNLFDLKLLVPEDLPKAAELLTENGRGKATGPTTYTIRRKAGGLVPIEVRTFPVLLDHKRVVLGIARDISRRVKAAEALARSEAELAAMYDEAPMMICVVNAQGQVERMNRTMTEFIGANCGDLGLKRPGDLFGCVHSRESEIGCGHGKGCERCPLPLAVFTTLQTGQSCRQVETKMVMHLNGARREVHISASTALVRFQQEGKVLLFFEDITAKKQLEAQLIQSQKMEAVGQLAGGVAHDFNNILAAMLLQIEFLEVNKSLNGELNSAMRELKNGLLRAANLTRQLLLFGRRHSMEVNNLDLRKVVEGLMKMLKRLIGEHIEIILHNGAAQQVRADAGMLEQVVMNLCVNARDAMPSGGILSIFVETVSIMPEAPHNHPDARTGRFACLRITDTGCGMDEATIKRIFEPFFTTKPEGKGTGLGLATVYGIVKQHQGWVEVESTPGHGTTFRVFLPSSESLDTAEPRPIEQTVPGGSETILVVEDDANLRRVVRLTLARLGYKVLEARNGVEASSNVQNSEVNLLFTDMVMPGGLTGLDVAGRFREVRPALKVIISSGYSADLVDGIARLPKGIMFLSKPYTPVSLGKMVRECLDSVD